MFIDDFWHLSPWHQQRRAKDYHYSRPALNTPFYNPAALEMTVVDPFGNRLTFAERQ